MCMYLMQTVARDVGFPTRDAYDDGGSYPKYSQRQGPVGYMNDLGGTDPSLVNGGPAGPGVSFLQQNGALRRTEADRVFGDDTDPMVIDEAVEHRGGFGDEIPNMRNYDDDGEETVGESESPPRFASSRGIGGTLKSMVSGRRKCRDGETDCRPIYQTTGRRGLERRVGFSSILLINA